MQFFKSRQKLKKENTSLQKNQDELIFSIFSFVKSHSMNQYKHNVKAKRHGVTFCYLLPLPDIHLTIIFQDIYSRVLETEKDV